MPAAAKPARFAAVLLSESDSSTGAGSARIDRWLWAVRLFKTRSLAIDACRAGSVEASSQPVKPAREVRVGETIRLRQGLVMRTVRVEGVPRSRVGAKQVPEFCTDLTPAEEYAKAREQKIQHVLARAKGSGRPTKRDRRAIEQLFDR